MKPSVLLDYQAAVERDGFVVRALLKLEGQAARSGRAPLNISLVLDRSGSMSGDKLHRSTLRRRSTWLSGRTT